METEENILIEEENRLKPNLEVDQKQKINSKDEIRGGIHLNSFET